MMFERSLLNNDDKIQKIFTTYLLKSETATDLSRLMSEIGKISLLNWIRRIKEFKMKQHKAFVNKKGVGNTSVDRMMEDTPANYNF